LLKKGLTAAGVLSDWLLFKKNPRRDIMKKGIRNVFIFLLAVIAINLAFPGGQGEDEKTAEKTVLNVPTMAGWGPVHPVWQKQNDFREETGATWIIHEFPGSEIMAKELMELSEQTRAFDVITANHSTFTLFSEFMRPLDEFIERDFGGVDNFKDQFSKACQLYMIHGGKILYWPYHANVQFAVYRKKLFEDPKEKEAFRARYGYELKPPATWEELVDVAKFFRRPEQEHYGFQFMGKGKAGGYSIISSFLSEGLELADFSTKEAPFSSGSKRQLALQILRNWHYLLENDLVPSGVAGMGHSETVEMYKLGKTAISFGWWGDHMGKLRQPEVLDSIGETGTISLPTSKPDEGVLLTAHGYGIPKTCECPELAWEFIKFIGSRDIQLLMSEYSGQASPIIEYTNEGIQKGYIPTAMAEILPVANMAPGEKEMLSVMNVYFRYGSAFFAGEYTPEEFLDLVIEETRKVFR
jgi:multiple sugar transport system substrate-binding protein